MINIIVGSKNSAAPTHFIQGPRPMPRRKKCLRMNKEGPSCQETSPRTILSSANRNRKKEERHAHKDSLLGRPKQKGLIQWVSHGSMVEKQFQEKLSPPQFQVSVSCQVLLLSRGVARSRMWFPVPVLRQSIVPFPFTICNDDL